MEEAMTCLCLFCLSKFVQPHQYSYVCPDSAMDPPSSVQLTGIQNGQTQFRWTPIDSCTPVRYAISTNCSTQCSPMTTNQTTTSCTVLEPTTVIVCDFNVQSVVCGNLMGNIMRTAVIIFQGKWLVSNNI